MPYLSIISPVYNAENIIPQLVKRIIDSIVQITDNFEIILIDDGSSDQSWKIIEKQSEEYYNVKGIKLSRNFGQHYAITAGLDHSKGDWVVVMDCDLQDKPEEITKLHAKAIEGYDIVLARRYARKDRYYKKIFSIIFYRTLGYLTGSKLDETVANFGIYNKKVIEAVKQMRESIRYFPTMVKWTGFRTEKINVEHDYSIAGKSNYNLKKLLRLALDIILAYSDKPIRLLIKIGLMISVIAFIFALITLIRWIKGDIVVLGYTSIFISIWLLSGIIISTLGLVGLYVGKIFEGVKKRPIYVIDEIIS
ncbi:MAG: glycosyltransferase family 2 protein [Bacteroidales bacterium]|nr:glycosyltransferase family 2 protein [Bacteroidales bacterium]